MRPGYMAPKVVCAGAVTGSGAAKFLLRGEVAEWLADAIDDCLAGNATIDNAFIAYDNVCMAAWHPSVRDRIAEGYRQLKFGDCQELARMYHIATRGELDPRKGAYTLAGLAKPLGFELDKDTHRLRYGEYDLIERWEDWPDPEGAAHYAKEDAIAARAVFDHYWQLSEEAGLTGMLSNFWEQCRASFWLHLAGVWGVKVDGKLLQSHFIDGLREATETATKLLFEKGILRKNIRRPRTEPTWDGSYILTDKEVQKYLSELEIMHGLRLPRTPKGKISTSQYELPGAMKNVQDDVARAIVFYKGLASQRGLLERLEQASHSRAHFRFRTSVETGRTASGGGTLGMNSQNMRKDWGWRQLFIPDDPHRFLFGAIDFPQIELRTLAQTCIREIGYSKLGDTLNAGRDPHLVTAASLLQIPYETAVKRLADGDPEVGAGRQCSKALNFGLPGGLGEWKFIEWAAAQYNQVIPNTAGSLEFDLGLVEVEVRDMLNLGIKTLRATAIEGVEGLPEEALLRVETDPPGEFRLKLWEFYKHSGQGQLYLDPNSFGYLAYRWFAAYPEIAEYLQWVKDEICKKNDGLVVMPTGWTVANRTFTQGANTGFQHPVSMGLKRGGWYVTDACYFQPNSPCFGSRVWNEVHDELLMQVSWQSYQPALEGAARLFAQGMDEFIPDVPCAAGTEAAAMRRWDKAAEPFHDDNGVLIPWEDVILATYPSKLSKVSTQLRDVEDEKARRKLQKYRDKLEFELKQTESFFRRFDLKPML